MTLQTLLDEISIIPGVTSSCVFDSEQARLRASAGKSYHVDTLVEISSLFSRALKMSEMNHIAINCLHYRFDTCTAVATPLVSGNILVTLCNPKANCSLVASTAKMLTEDLKKHLAVLPQDSQELDAILLEDEIYSDENGDTALQDYFEKIEEALAEAIGPVAGMILQDHITTWLKKGSADMARIDQLHQLLLQEIADPDLFDEFVHRIKHLSAKF